MPFQDTVAGGLLKAIPRGQFARLVAAHGSDKGVRRLSSWGQLMALLVAQLAGCASLRAVEALLACQDRSLYHLGAERVCRSTLAVANAKRPAAMFEALFALLLQRLGARLPCGVGREAVQLVDATSIRLSETLFRWARHSAEYAGVKLHLVFDPVAAVPTYFTITPSRVNDIVEAKKMPLTPGATYVLDKGYYAFAFWAEIDRAGCRFVTRRKRNSPTRLVEERPVTAPGILADRLVRLSERLMGQRRNPYQGVLREVVVERPQGKPLHLISNDLESPPERIAELYKTRWQIEVVFTQMTKPHLLAAGAERDDVADLDLAIGDQHAVDQQLHELALLGEVGAGQTRPNPAAEVRGRGGPAGELGLPIHLRLEPAGLRVQRVKPLLQRLSAALVFRQRDDGEQVGLGQPLQLPLEAEPSLA